MFFTPMTGCPPFRALSGTRTRVHTLVMLKSSIQELCRYTRSGVMLVDELYRITQRLEPGVSNMAQNCK
jgi:hypothetical protein